MCEPVEPTLLVGAQHGVEIGRGSDRFGSDGAAVGDIVEPRESFDPGDGHREFVGFTGHEAEQFAEVGGRLGGGQRALGRDEGGGARQCRTLSADPHTTDPDEIALLAGQFVEIRIGEGDGVR